MAGHVLGILRQQQESGRRRAGYRENVIEFQRELAADKRYRKQGVRTFHLPEGSAVSNHSAWWGVDGMELVEAKVRPSADLALCRLEPFDADAVVWGIQSHTVHYPLGFSPPIPGARQGQVAHQFLNTGLAVHAAVIRRFLDDEGIAYEGEG